VKDGAAYVSDNRADQLYRVEPADFLAASVQPRAALVWEKKGVFPNGLWPGRNGRLIMVGFESAEKHRGIYAMGRDGAIESLSPPIGRLDGLYERPDGTLLATDWDSGSVFRYGPKGHLQELAKDFKGPADLCVMGDKVYVPDLMKGEVRILTLDR
jgi:sugar lactone lactonase YvrE